MDDVFGEMKTDTVGHVTRDYGAKQQQNACDVLFLIDGALRLVLKHICE